jgi:hypothetical protein
VMQFDLQAWRHQDKRGVIPSGAAFQAERGISLKIVLWEIRSAADGCPRLAEFARRGKRSRRSRTPSTSSPCRKDMVYVHSERGKKPSSCASSSRPLQLSL